jgi:hypothetical protein
VSINIRADYVRLHLVPHHPFGRGRVADRVNEVKQLCCPIAITEQRSREHHPRGGMCILAAILANPRHIALDVARVEAPAVERRSE